MRGNWLAGAGITSLLICGALAAQNQVLDELTQRGLDVAADAHVKLPTPAMKDGLDAAGQSAVLDQLADRYPREEFLRRSVVAPFVLKFNSLPGQSRARAAQTVSLWFIAYGDLATVRSEKLLQELGSAAQVGEGETAARTEVLTDDELAKRQLASRPTDDQRQWFVACRIPILDRVLVDGVVHLIQTDSDESSLVAARLDPRFHHDPTRPNQWRSIRVDQFGTQRLGEPQPYAGFGGYIKATQLIEPAGSMLIEVQAVFSEPEGWFGGTNQLRSKLPIVIQDNVRTFRRKLSK